MKLQHVHNHRENDNIDNFIRVFNKKFFILISLQIFIFMYVEQNVSKNQVGNRVAAILPNWQVCFNKIEVAN